MATVRPSELLIPLGYPNADVVGGAGQTQSDFTGSSLKSLAELMKVATFSGLHPELQRRHVAMWVASFVETGRRMGIGTGSRSYATQLAAWQRDPRQFVHPDYSYHVDRLPSGMGMAVDNVPGDTFNWLATAAKRFQLRVLTANERHHTQFIEVPTSASMYSRNPSGYFALIKMGAPLPYLGTLSLDDWLARNEPIDVDGPTAPVPPAGCTVRTELALGMSGTEVSCLQTALRSAGRSISVDGNFGPKTEEHVKAYQSANGLTADGRAGEATCTKLGIWAGAVSPPPATPTAPNGLTAAENVAAGTTQEAPAPTIKRETVGENAARLQQILSSMFKLPPESDQRIFPPLEVGGGTINGGTPQLGLFGDEGVEALKYWQGANGLVADGIYGPKSAALLDAVQQNR